MLWSCSHFFKILRNKNPHIAFDAPHPSLSSFDLWFPISCEGRDACLRFPERRRWYVYLYFDFQTWKLLKAVWEENTTTAFAWKPVVWQHSLCIQNQTVTKVGKKNPNRNGDAVLPQKATIQHYKIILFKLSCHVSSDCRLWTKLKESKYEIANSVTICWNRVLSKFRFFACFKPNVTLLEIKVGLTCCSISLLPLSWPFPVRNIVQWKCWCWCLHFR